MTSPVQDSEEIKSNSLDTQLRAKEELLQKLKLDKASEQEVDTVIMITVFIHCKPKDTSVPKHLQYLSTSNLDIKILLYVKYINKYK